MKNRFLHLAAALGCALSCACGTSSGETGSGSNAPPDGGVTPPPATRVVLEIQAGANGLVHGAGADCRGTCRVALDTGTAVHLQAFPDSGYGFSGWTGACAGSGACDLTLTADRTVAATFAALPPRAHRLTVAVDGQGRVVSNPAGIDCPGAACAAEFAEGTTVVLTAAAPAGWSFGGWTEACSGTGACSVRLDGEVSVRARFDAPPPPPSSAHVIVSIEGRGQVTGSGISCGAGATACDVTVPAGATVTLDQAAAAEARFAGWTGPCSGSASSCAFAASGEVRVTARFVEVVTLLAADDGRNVRAMAINSREVFYQRYIDGAGSIWAVPKTGGQARQVAAGLGYILVADDGFVYWTDNNSLWSAPVQGGPASLLLSGAGLISRLALDQNGALYFTTSRFNPDVGSVHRMQDRRDTVLASFDHGVGLLMPGLAVDDRYVYFAILEPSEARNGLLQRVSKAGGAVETMTSCGSHCQIVSIKADGGFVYYRGDGDQAWSIGKADGRVRLLTASNGDSGTSYTYYPEIDANAGVAYWNMLAAANGRNGIFSARGDGTGWTPVDSASDHGWYVPRVDDTAIYYFHGGALLRRLR